MLIDQYELNTDYNELKKQIKEWENIVDNLILKLYPSVTTDDDIIGDLDKLSHEMMSINM